ncbi:HEAT repeat-containing protein 5B, partial [Operophtera brumata]
VWSLHALSVLADASGPMFRSHVDSTLSLALRLLFVSPPFPEELHRGVGRLLAALITVKEAAEVCRHAMMAKDHVPAKPYCGVVITETGLPGALFAYLDIERDAGALSHARDTLTCCLLAAASAAALKDWLALAKRVLTVRLEDSNNPDTDLDMEGDDDQAEFHAESEQSTHPAVQASSMRGHPNRTSRGTCCWSSIKLRSVEIRSFLRRVGRAETLQLTDTANDHSAVCEGTRTGLPGALAAGAVSSSGPIYGESDALRLRSLRTLQMIIQQYARAPELDFPGHLLLEQYQAHLTDIADDHSAVCEGTRIGLPGALAARAVSSSASHVTAAACDVCSAWIGCGVARDINDLRRMATLEKLSILKAWAELPHGGGAFYSAETAEASRAHYARAWPSLLYAASLRFNANINTAPASNNESSENNLDNRSSKTENGNFEFFEPIDERFHLLF